MPNDRTYLITGEDVSEKEFVKLAKERGATDEMIEEARETVEEAKKDKIGIKYTDFLKRLNEEAS